MIEIYQRIDPDSRTANRGAAWIAEAMYRGEMRSARSRNGAPYELARQLVAAGVPDQPVRVMTDGHPGWLSYRSLHAIATRTIGESATKPINDVKWSPAPDASEFDAGSRRIASKADPGTSRPQELEGQKNAVPAPLAVRVA